MSCFVRSGKYINLGYRMNLKVWIASASLALSGIANALTVDFTMVDPVSSVGAVDHYADVFNYQLGDVNMSVSAWSTGGDSYDPFSSMSQASVGLWNGIMGVESSGLSHTVDNLGFDYDFLVFEFDREVSIDAIGVGYIEDGADSDISIGAIDDGELLSSGNIFDALLGANPVDTGEIASSIWLVGAFHPFFGEAQDAIWDGFKLNQVSVNVNPVPLPPAFLFLGTGLFFVAYLRRKAS